MINKDDLLQEISKLGDSQKAIDAQRYHKSKRVHWGVTMPQCDQFVKSFSKGLSQEELLSIAETFWMTDLFDPMMCASKILSLSCIKPSPFLWKMLNNFLTSVDGWALEDCLAHAAWKCILKDPKLLDEVEEWTMHPNFWMRRAALVYTLPFAKPKHDPERMLKWAASYASDTEWFIQKAIGWWLRVLGGHNPDRVILFLNTHWSKLKTVAKKEATRKLSSEFQNKVKLFQND